MPQYCIIETDDGWTIFEHADDVSAAETAERHGGTVIDPGPYTTYEDAVEALDALQGELDESIEGVDTPGAQPLDGRFETDN